MQVQKKGTKNLTRTCPTALALYFPFSFTFVLFRRGRRAHLLPQISRLLGFSHSAQQGSEVMEVVVAETAAIKTNLPGM
jgi:hypothetical protein